jgi:hypothetical protein
MNETSEPRDMCLCGHERADHADTWGHCEVCRFTWDGSTGDQAFLCEPGACDRFTWDPKGEGARPR